MRRKSLFLMVVVLLGVVASDVHGVDAVIENITATSVDSVYGTIPDNTINGSGISGDLHDNSYVNMWMGNIGAEPNRYSAGCVAGENWMAYRFDQAYEVNEMWVWNYNNYFVPDDTGHGFKNVSVQYSVTGGPDSSEWTTLNGGLIQFNKAPSPGVAGYAHNTEVDFGGAQAKYVVITPDFGIGNGWWGPYSWYVGLSEVRFFGAARYASNPSPADSQANVAQDSVLSWTRGESAVSHDIYIGTNWYDVNDASRASHPGVELIENRTEANCTPSLDFEKPYYWRVDGVNDLGIPQWTGDIWRFTTVGTFILNVTATAMNENPWGENRIAANMTNNSGMVGELHSNFYNDMWLGLESIGPANPGTVSGLVWVRFDFDKVYDLEFMKVWNNNHVGRTERGFRNVTVEYSTTGGSDSSEWTTLGNYEWAKASGDEGGEGFTVSDFNGVQVKYVVITPNDVNGNWGGTGDFGELAFGLSEVRFFDYPEPKVLKATNPTPGDQGEGVAPGSILSWVPGETASAHNIYLGTDRDSVAGAMRLSGDVDADGYTGPLDLLITANQWLTDPSGLWPHSDMTGDKTVNMADFVFVGNDWEQLSDASFKGAQPVDSNTFSPALEFGQTYYWRIDEVNTVDGNSPWTGDIWSFSTAAAIVPEASTPRPEDNGYGFGRFLKWTAGTHAANTNGHDVYFGTSFADVNSATTASSEYIGRQSSTIYDNGAYDDGNGPAVETQYFWRIDEVNIAGIVYPGAVWDFINRRRVINNDDGRGSWVQAGGMGGSFDQDLWLSELFNSLEDTHVDTLTWCDGDEGATTRYDSNVAEHWGAYIGNEDPDLVAMYADGNDPPELIVAEAHARGIEVFYSYRINGNDHEDESMGQVRVDNPSWLLEPGSGGASGTLSPYGYWYQFNFAVEGVRDYKFDMIEEIAEKYDFDGIEIDLMRAVPFFMPETEPANAYILTNFLSRVRTRLNEIGTARGRKFFVAIRVDENIEVCDLDGLDVNSWVEDDLLDILIMGASVIDINVADFTAITVGTDVTVYPCLYGYPSNYRPLPENMAYALATNYWYQGADGIHLFNWSSFSQWDYDVDKLTTIGNRDDLIGKDKIFPAERNYDPPQFHYPHNWLHVELPRWLDYSNGTIDAPVLVGEDIDGTVTPSSVELHVEFSDLDSGESLEIALNGTVLGWQIRQGQSIVLPLMSYHYPLVQVGQNSVSIKLNAGSVKVEAVELHVNY